MQYFSDFVEPTAADRLFSRLDDRTWTRETFKMFGRSTVAPRSLLWFGDAGVNYRYTGNDHVCTGWPSDLESVLEQIRTRIDVRFNFALLNKYVDGSQHIGWHRDDEKGCAAQVASISLGASRRFRIEAATGQQIDNVELEHGSLLVFDGRRRHCLPRTQRRVLPRINITFRHVAS